MRRIKRIRGFERGQSTLEMIAIAPMLFGFIYMVFAYGVPIYYKLGLQNVSYSYGLATTRFPVVRSVDANLKGDVDSNVVDSIPGFSSIDSQILQYSVEGAAPLSDLADTSNKYSLLATTKLTMGLTNDPMYQESNPALFMKLMESKMTAGAIGPRSPFISCEAGDEFCKGFGSGSYIWK